MKHARQDYNRIQDPEGLIPEDEPVFLIRAQDQMGPQVLRYWADMSEAHGADKKIITMVRDHATEMENWQATKVSKVPDLPENSVKL